MRKAYADLTREVSKTGPRLEKQESQLAENARELDRIRGAALAASTAMRQVGQASQTAQGLNARQAQTQAANEAARRGLAELSKAERGIQIEINARERAAEEAAENQRRANAQIVTAVQTLIKEEQRLAAVQARRAAIEQARGANANARAGLAGITANLEARARAENNANRATEAARRANDALAASYERQRVAARVSSQDQAKLAASFRQAFTAAQQYQGPLANVYRELLRIGPATNQAADGVRRLGSQMTNGRQVFRAFYGDSRQALSLMQRLRGEVLSLTAAFVGFYGVFNVGRGITESFQSLEAAQNRLGAAFQQDYVQVNAELARLSDEASRLGVSFNVLADNYSKFLLSGQQAGLEVTQLERIFRQVTEAGRVLKLSNDQIEGTFTALIQIAGKGTLQMEELRQQLGDRLPGAVGLLANALGYGSDELAQFYKDVENGAIGAEQALVALGQGLEDQYGGQLEDALDSVTAKLGALQNLLFQRQLTAANSGFISGLETALEALNKWLESPEGIQFFESLGAAFGKLFELVPVVIDNFGTLITLFQTLIAIKVGQTVAGLAGGFVTLTRTTVGNLRVQVAPTQALAAYSPAAAAALRSTTALGAGLRGLRAAIAGVAVAMRAAFASIGGIVGIAAAALSFFAFDTLASVTDEMAELRKASEDAADTIGLVAKAFRDAGGDADVFRQKLASISQVDLELDLGNLKTQLDQALNNNRDSVTGFAEEVETLRRAIYSSSADTQGRLQFLRLTNLFNAGEITAREFRKEIENLNRQFDGIADIDGLDVFIDWLDQIGEAQDNVARLEAELAVLQGTATDAQKELLGIADATTAAERKAKAARDQMKAFEEAMRTLGENIPSINAKLKEFDAIREIEADFQAAMQAADAFTDAAQRAAAIGQAVDLRNRAYNEFYDGTISQFNGTDGAEVAAAVLREFEGFRAQPYYDVNAFRAGYGSDTVTLADGTIRQVTEGMTVSVADANRDLLRRITTEFMPRAAAAVGQDRFNGFNAQQQAALTSIAYNYGDIPDRIVQALRTGTTEEIADAIRSLGGDNGGINRNRRNREAALFSTNAGEENAVREFEREQQRQREEAEKRLEDQREFREGLQEEIRDTEFLNSLEGQRLIDSEVAKAIREAENEAKKVGLELTQQEREQIEQVTRAKFASKQAEEDRNAQLEKARALEEQANLLQDRRRFLIEQITDLEGQGRLTEAAGLTEELNEVEAALREALDAAIAFWEALGGEGSERALQALTQTQAELNRVESTAVTTGRQMNEMFAQKITSGIENFLQRVAQGENAVSAFGAAFAQMASEILLELGRMIIQQAIFNAISGAFGGGAAGQGGLGGVVAGGINSIFAHSGGVAGSSTLRAGRTFNPAVFANAARYHTGGIAGFAPDEVPAVLKRNEEILTENDPRHRFNGGMSGGGAGDKSGTTIINAFDAEEMMERALSSPRGERVLLNTVRSQRTQIKAALG